MIRTVILFGMASDMLLTASRKMDFISCVADG